MTHVLIFLDHWEEMRFSMGKKKKKFLWAGNWFSHCKVLLTKGIVQNHDVKGSLTFRDFSWRTSWVNLCSGLKKSLQFAAWEEPPRVSSLTSSLVTHDSDVHEVRPQKPCRAPGHPRPLLPTPPQALRVRRCWFLGLLSHSRESEIHLNASVFNPDVSF